MPWEKAEADTIREMLFKEAEFTNHRITWLIQIQGLLFAALGFAWKNGREVVWVIALLGITVALSSILALKLGDRAYYMLLDKWRKESCGCYKGPPVRGLEGECRPRLECLYPWWLLPYLFTVAWVLILLISSGWWSKIINWGWWPKIIE